jgi:hypothetical protein
MGSITYRAIASTTLTTATASVSFSGIDTRYYELVLKTSTRSDSASGILGFAIATQAGSTGTRSSGSATYGSGTGGGTLTSTITTDATTYVSNIGGTTCGTTYTANAFPFANIEISRWTQASNASNGAGFAFGYRASAPNGNASNGVSTLGMGSASNGTNQTVGGFTITPSAGNFIAGSRFDLYGIQPS